MTKVTLTEDSTSLGLARGSELSSISSMVESMVDARRHVLEEKLRFLHADLQTA